MTAKHNLYKRLTWFFMISIGMVNTSRAQVNINTSELKKIQLIDYSGGLGGSRETIFEIVREKGSWACYQTKQLYAGMGYLRRRDSMTYMLLNSTDRKLVKPVSDTSIQHLLWHAANIKPVFKPEYLPLDRAEMIRQIDSAYLKGGYHPLAPKQRQEFLGLLKSKKIFAEAITAMQSEYWTDDWPYCGIWLIKNNNDTVKIDTHRQISFMLPWEIKGVKSYDAYFGGFVSRTIGNYPQSVRSRLSAQGVPWAVYMYIERQYTNQLFERERLQTTAPAELNLLKQHFNILDTHGYNGQGSALLLEPKYALGLVRIRVVLNVANKESVDQLVRYSADTLRNFLQKENFVIKRCKDTKDCLVVFSHRSDTPVDNHYFAHQNDRHKLLAKYKDSEMITFYIGRTNDDASEEWLYLPDGQLLLYAYYHDDAIGLPADTKPAGNTWRKDVFMFFEPAGKLLRNLPVY